MLSPAVVIGIGELGSVFARGLLRSGHPVHPVTRDMDMAQAAARMPTPELALLAVAENDLYPTLEALPALWQDRLALLQNELLPRDWQAHQIEEPSVVCVWFEKKRGMDAKVLLPSPVYGPHAQTLLRALAAVHIPAREVDSADALLFELVRKNVYILTSNIAGLVVDETVEDLWRDHEALAREVADEVISIQEWLTDCDLPRDRLIEGMLEAFHADPAHRCRGRSAPGRLQRALTHADQTGLAVPKLREIHHQHQARAK